MLKPSKAFTLLEVLLVVAALGILAAIVVFAVNPQRQMGKVRDAERQGEVNTLKGGIEQYVLDNEVKYPSGIELNSYNEICDTEAVDPSSCPSDYVDLSSLVPGQLASVPRDPQASETNANTGYEVGKDEDGNITVKAPNTEIDSSVKRAGPKLPVGYTLSSASYDNQSVDVSGKDTSPMGMTFNGDGTKMFIVGDANDSVYSYNLSTAYDLDTASYNQSLDVSGEDQRPMAVKFNDDGTRMFVVGFWYDNVYRYNLSTAYDISSASYDEYFYTGGQDEYAVGATFNGDGTKIFVTGTENDTLYDYDLSTAYDFGTVTYNQSLDVSGQDTEPAGMRFNRDGTKMFVVGGGNDNVYSYDLSTAYDIGSASYNQSFDVSGEDIDPEGATFNGDGTKMFVVGSDSGVIYRYSTAEEQ